MFAVGFYLFLNKDEDEHCAAVGAAPALTILCVYSTKTLTKGNT